MLHHLAGYTIHVANLVNYNCRPQEDGKRLHAITVDYGMSLYATNNNKNLPIDTVMLTNY